MKINKYTDLPNKYADYHNLISSIPFGHKVIMFVVSIISPYTATLDNAKVTTLTEDTCVVVLKEETWYHNPFHSIHACALFNLAEFAAGLAMFSSIQYSSNKVRKSIFLKMGLVFMYVYKIYYTIV